MPTATPAARTTRNLFAAGAAIAALAIGAAVAATAVSPLPAAMQRLLDCHAVTADPARLACYDSAVSEVGKLIASGELVVIDHERVAKVKRQAFGFSLPSLSLFERGGGAEELSQISGVVDTAYQRGDGKWIVELADGGVWEQTDDEKLLRGAHKGSKAEVRKAAMGSFFMNIDGQRALRMRRVR